MLATSVYGLGAVWQAKSLIGIVPVAEEKAVTAMRLGRRSGRKRKSINLI